MIFDLHPNSTAIQIKWHLLQLQLHRRREDLEELAAPKVRVCACIKQVCQVWTLHPEDYC